MGVVRIVIPGSTNGLFFSFRCVAARMTLARVGFRPAFLRVSTMVNAVAIPAVKKPLSRSREPTSLPYFFRIDWNRRTPLSRFHSGAAGSLPNTIEIEPFAAFWGTASMSADAEETSLTKVFGFQFSRETALYAWSENLPKAKIMKTFAPDAFSRVTCGWTSAVVGS